MRTSPVSYIRALMRQQGSRLSLRIHILRAGSTAAQEGKKGTHQEMLATQQPLIVTLPWVLAISPPPPPKKNQHSQGCGAIASSGRLIVLLNFPTKFAPTVGQYPGMADLFGKGHQATLRRKVRKSARRTEPPCKGTRPHMQEN